MQKLIVLVSALLLGFVSAAHGESLYGSEYGGAALYSIDKATGGSSTVGDPTGSTKLPGLAFHRGTQTMYATDETNLYTVNLANAATTLVGAHGATVTGLTFSGDYTKLFAIGYDGNLYSINPATGAATSVGALGVAPTAIVDLATNSTGVVYAAGLGSYLYTVNTTTGAATQVGVITGIAPNLVTAISFDEGDVLYGVSTNTDELYTIDTTTSVATLVGGDIGDDVRGLAFALPIPYSFSTSQTIDGKTVTCSSATTTANYTECLDLKADGLYFPNGITCGPTWSTTNSSYSDTQGFCESLTGSTTFEAYYACDFSQPRATWDNHVWSTFNDNGYTQHVRCYFGAVTAAPDLTATKTASGNLASGGQVTYTVTISNNGTGAQPDNAGDEFVDELPAGLQLLSASATSGTEVANTGNDTVTWNGGLTAGSSVTITIVASIQAGEGTVISNQGTVYFDGDNNGSNESSNVTDDPGAGGAGDATAITVGAAAVAPSIPALSPFALGLLALMLAGAAFVAMRLQP